MGHLMNPWWVTGPVYAKGKHVNGHEGIIYSAPYGNGGADVEITPVWGGGATPWYCGCERLDGAFLAAGRYMGAGWRWQRCAPRPADQEHVVLHCLMDVKSGRSGVAKEHLRNWGIEQVLSRSLLRDQVVIEARGHEHIGPVTLPDLKKPWISYGVAITCGMPNGSVRFGTVYRDRAIRLQVLSVVQ